MADQEETTLSRGKTDGVSSPPYVGSRTCDEPELKFSQQCVLTLIELDPRLTYDKQRWRLRELAKVFHPRLGHEKVGRSLGRLKEMNREGALITPAFAPQTREDPELKHSVEVIDALGRRCGWVEKSADEVRIRRVRALRLLGHVVPPRAPLVIDALEP
jgi:hypothetical protein